MSRPLRVGVIGLGRRWRKHYRPALQMLRQHFTIGVLCDQVMERAEREAQALTCDMATGPAALCERDDLDALLLLDRQWFALWPLELACRRGLPVFCCPSLELEAHADAVCEKVRAAGIPVMVEMPPRFAPATIALQEKQPTASRLLLCEMRRVGGQASSLALLGPGGLALVDWCLHLFGTMPVSVQAALHPTVEFASVILTWEDGRTAQINSFRAGGERSHIQLQSVGGESLARIELPNVLHYIEHGIQCTQRLKRQSLALAMLKHFHQAVIEKKPPQPSLDDAYRALHILRAAVRSQAEGRRTELGA